MKTILLTLLGGALLTIAVAVAFMYSGLYDVSASSPHSALTNWAMSTTMKASMRRRANNIVVPDLSDNAMALAGVNDFEAMCVGCHGAPGKEPGSAGKGLNPPAPSLQEVAQDRTPAELFWATKFGIKMTGMPAWGASHDDDALWPVVAFMTTLPDLDAQGYQALLANATGMGHHANESDAGAHDHGDGGTTPATGADDHQHDDPAAATPDHHDAPGAPPHDHDEPAPQNEDGHDHEH